MRRERKEGEGRCDNVSEKERLEGGGVYHTMLIIIAALWGRQSGGGSR